MFALLVSPARVLAFCHELEVVQRGGIMSHRGGRRAASDYRMVGPLDV